MSGGARGFHAGGNAGSGIPYVIPNSVRHPMRDLVRHMWPGIPCGMHCGVRAPASDHDFSAGLTAGSGPLSSVASLIEGPHPDEVTAPGLNPVL